MVDVTDQEPVLVLDGKKYIISDLSQEAQYCVGQLNTIQQDINVTSAALDRANVAYTGFTDRLKELVNTNEPESEE